MTLREQALASITALLDAIRNNLFLPMYEIRRHKATIEAWFGSPEGKAECRASMLARRNP